MATTLSDRPATNLVLSDRPATRLVLTDRPVASGTITAIAIGIGAATARLTTLFNARAEDAVGVGVATADSHMAYGTTPVGATGTGLATADAHMAYGTAPVTAVAVGAASAAGVAIYNATGSAAGAGSASADVHTLFTAQGAATGVGSGSADLHTLFNATATAAAVGAATVAGEAIYNATASGAGVGSATATGTNTFQATMSGNEITDAMRTTNAQGDGLAPPASRYGVWDNRTNLALNGSWETNNASWGTGGVFPLTRSNEQAKFGSWSAKAISNGTTSDSNMGYEQATMTNGVTYAVSRWVYIPSSWDGGTLSIQPEGSKTILFSVISDNAKRDQWQRISNVFTWTGTTGTVAVTVRCASFPTSGKFVYQDGDQIEQGSYPTPYIHTDGATATRNKPRIQFPATLASLTQGWVIHRLRVGVANANRTVQPVLFDWRDGPSNNLITFDSPSPTSNQWRMTYKGGAGNQAIAIQTLTTAIGDPLTAIGKWAAASTVGLSINGAAFTNTSHAFTSSGLPTTFEMGALFGNSNYWNGEILWIAVGLGTLTNADATTVSGWGDTDPTWAQLLALNGGVANPTMLWTADTATVIKA